MPRRPREHVLDDQAEQAFRSALPDEWIFRPVDRHDYGIDGTVEVFEDEQPTGEVFNVQLKGTDDEDDGSGSRARVRVHTAEYWGLQQLPTLLVRFHSSSSNLYARWWHRHAFDPDPGQSTLTVHFVADDKWSGATPLALTEEVRAYHILRSSRVALPLRLHILHEGDVIYGLPAAAIVMSVRSAAERLPKLVEVRTDAPTPGAATIAFRQDRAEIDLGGSGVVLHHDLPYGDQRPIDAIGFDSLLGISFALGRIGLVTTAASIASVAFPRSTFVTQETYAARVGALFLAAHRVTEGVGLAQSLLDDVAPSVVAAMAIELGQDSGLLSRGDEAELAKLFTDIAVRTEATDPPLAAGSWLSAASLQQQIAPEDAVASLRRAADVSPELEGTAEWWKNLAGAAHDAGDLDSAIDAYRSAIALSSDPESVAALADSLLTAGQFHEADQTFQRASNIGQLDPKWSVSQVLSGHLAASVDAGWPEALAAADAEPVNSSSDLPEAVNRALAWFNRGVSYSESGDDGKALYCYLAAVILFPGDDESWNNSLISAMKIGSPELVAAVIRSGYAQRGYAFLDEILERTRDFPADGIEAVMEMIELFTAPTRTELGSSELER